MFSFSFLCADQSSELSLALKRSQLELADALHECEKLRKEQILMQVNHQIMK